VNRSIHLKATAREQSAQGRCDCWHAEGKDRESARFSAGMVTLVSQFRNTRRFRQSNRMQFRLNLQGRGIRGGVHERIQYADVESKNATNCNDEAEGAQTEIHRSFANEGAESGPRPCRFSASAVLSERRSAADCAS
jgi:hypothetical protein